MFSNQDCQKVTCLLYITQENIQKFGVRLNINLQCFFNVFLYIGFSHHFSTSFSPPATKEEPAEMDQNDFVHEKYCY